MQKVQDALNNVGKAVKGSRILILGVAYKKDVSDLRESPALDIIHLLKTKGALVVYHDPHVPAFVHDGLDMTAVSDVMQAVQVADCVVIVTDHTTYKWHDILTQSVLTVNTCHAVEKRVVSG